MVLRMLEWKKLVLGRGRLGPEKSREDVINAALRARQDMSLGPHISFLITTKFAVGDANAASTMSLLAAFERHLYSSQSARLMDVD